MRFVETGIPGACQIFSQVSTDRRGSFTKTFHAEQFEMVGLQSQFREQYYSVSHAGVLRGLHFQTPPHQHAKLVFCTVGHVFDAIVDLRVDSPTFGKHEVFELSVSRGNALLIPPGLAHGFYALVESTLVYNVSTEYVATNDAGILWRSVGIPWPSENPILSVRDMSFPPFCDFQSSFSFVKR